MERENKERRNELQRLERRLVQKEESLDRKTEGIERKEEQLSRKDAEAEKLKAELSSLCTRQVAELERVSGLSSDEARQILLSDVEKEIQHEAAILIKEIENKAKEEGEKRAREVITSAIQRCAATSGYLTSMEIKSPTLSVTSSPPFNLACNQHTFLPLRHT